LGIFIKKVIISVHSMINGGSKKIVKRTKLHNEASNLLLDISLRGVLIFGISIPDFRESNQSKVYFY